MKSAFHIAITTCFALLVVSTAAAAKDPLLGTGSASPSVSEKDLSHVKGSGAFAGYYGYYGSLGAYYSYLYGVQGNNYNAGGLEGSAYNSYLNARDQAAAAAANYSAAAYYAYYGQ